MVIQMNIKPELESVWMGIEMWLSKNLVQECRLGKRGNWVGRRKSTRRCLAAREIAEMHLPIPVDPVIQVNPVALNLYLRHAGFSTRKVIIGLLWRDIIGPKVTIWRRMDIHEEAIIPLVQNLERLYMDAGQLVCQSSRSIRNGEWPDDELV